MTGVATNSDGAARRAAAYETIPEDISGEWVVSFSANLEAATWRGPGAFKELLPLPLLRRILDRTTSLLKSEPTLVEFTPVEEGATVTIVGDTHGQVHDVLNMFKEAGHPSERNYYVFNGDFVDRGAWGLEVLLVLMAWKLAYPRQVTLLRGNHETTTCTTMYGFKGEIQQKVGKPSWKEVYTMCRKLFSVLPLAACIAGTTLVLHGGLFRKPVAPKKRKKVHAVPTVLGSLSDLRASTKGGQDPNGMLASTLATDVLWSDPLATPGLELNHCRGVGITFGPDITQQFLEENGLKLILRSHEGPDARFEREDMSDMQQGWTLDHTSTAGRLMTIFSAPDYPQFQPDEESRYANQAAVARIGGPTWCDPEIIQYSAVLPRPAASATYDFSTVPGSDEEMEIAGSELSASSLASDLHDTAHTNLPPPPPLPSQAEEGPRASSDSPRHAPSTRAASPDPLCAAPNTNGHRTEPSPSGASASTEPAAADSGDGPSSRAAAGIEQPGNARLEGVEQRASCEDAALSQDTESPSPTGRPDVRGSVEGILLPAPGIGRELEQAAAQTLALTGGVPSDSPIPPAALRQAEDGRQAANSGNGDLREGNGYAADPTTPAESLNPLKRPAERQPPKDNLAKRMAPRHTVSRMNPKGSSQPRVPWR